MEAADFSGMFFSVYQHYDENKLRALDILGKNSSDRICEQILGFNVLVPLPRRLLSWYPLMLEP
jgi:hypothetical protein